MYENSSDMFISFYRNIDLLLVIFIRMLGFVTILPVFTGRYIPVSVKVGLTFILSSSIFTNQIANINLIQMPVDNVILYFLLLLKEFLVGYTLGFTVLLFMSIVYFAGQLIDYQIGFSMLNVFDPSTNMQVPITGNIMFFIMMMFFIQTGGLHYILLSFLESYSIIPISTANLISNPALPYLLLNTISDFFVLGLRISMPIVGTILLINFTLGILVKAVPQMNVFVVGMPIKLLIGLVILYLTIPTYLDIYNTIFINMVELFKVILKGMIYHV